MDLSQRCLHARSYVSLSSTSSGSCTCWDARTEQIEPDLLRLRPPLPRSIRTTFTSSGLPDPSRSCYLMRCRAANLHGPSVCRQRSGSGSMLLLASKHILLRPATARACTQKSNDHLSLAKQKRGNNQSNDSRARGACWTWAGGRDMATVTGPTHTHEQHPMHGLARSTTLCVPVRIHGDFYAATAVNSPLPRGLDGAHAVQDLSATGTTRRAPEVLVSEGSRATRGRSPSRSLAGPFAVSLGVVSRWDLKAGRHPSPAHLEGRGRSWPCSFFCYMRAIRRSDLAT